MSQVYHQNAKSNEHSRNIIKKSKLKNSVLAKRFNISVKTIAKWKSRDFTKDKSSRPNTIHYSLNFEEKAIIASVRKLTWMGIYDLVDTVSKQIPKANKSNVSRALQAANLSRIPCSKKAQAKKFKEYEPGYLHIDITYMPKLDGVKSYLFVGIDRATRLMFYKVYKNKTAENSVSFLRECKSFFPFYISHVLTDNGAEFTDKWTRAKGALRNKHSFDIECSRDGIDHRLTAPYTPSTNGMVERVNGTIKNSTIKVENYQNEKELITSLNKFLLYYLFMRNHSGLRKELKVRTPYNALERWFTLKPELFKISPDEFKAAAFSKLEQRGEN